METTLTIPAHLVRETIRGVPYYYKGYRQVLSGQKTTEEIMGCSELQWYIVSLILRYLYLNLPSKHYQIGTNEVGIHLTKGNNPALDIAIFRTGDLKITQTSVHYTRKAPRAVIEVDVRVETETKNDLDYILEKSEALLHFGVEKVIWITTHSRRIFVQTADAKTFLNWNEPVHLFEDFQFTLSELIAAGEFPDLGKE